MCLSQKRGTPKWLTSCWFSFPQTSKTTHPHVFDRRFTEVPKRIARLGTRSADPSQCTHPCHRSLADSRARSMAKCGLEKPPTVHLRKEPGNTEPNSVPSGASPCAHVPRQPPAARVACKSQVQQLAVGNDPSARWLNAPFWDSRKEARRD